MAAYGFTHTQILQKLAKGDVLKPVKTNIKYYSDKAVKVTSVTGETMETSYYSFVGTRDSNGWVVTDILTGKTMLCNLTKENSKLADGRME